MLPSLNGCARFLGRVPTLVRQLLFWRQQFFAEAGSGLIHEGQLRTTASTIPRLSLVCRDRSLEHSDRWRPAQAAITLPVPFRLPFDVAMRRAYKALIAESTSRRS